MDQILLYAQTQPASLRSRLLSLLYKLLMMEAVPIKELSNETHHSKSPLQDEAFYRTGSGRDNNQLHEAQQQLEFTDLGRDMTATGMLDSDRGGLRGRADNIQEEFLGYMDDEDQIGTRFGNTEKERQRTHLNNKISKRRGSFDFASTSTVLKASIENPYEVMQFGTKEQKRNAIIFGQVKNKDVYLGNVWAKLPRVDSSSYGGVWKKYFARVQNSCIYLCPSVESNDFQACYVIYNCTIQTMKLPIPEWDGRQHNVLIIKHDFDTDYLLMALEDSKRDVNEISASLELKALEFSKESMQGKIPDQTNRYSFGKLYVRVKGLDHTPNIGKLFFRVKLGPFSLESRRMK